MRQSLGQYNSSQEENSYAVPLRAPGALPGAPTNWRWA
jgi:hypothetical protein